MDFFIHLVLGTILFLGGYQPYFWCQRRTKISSGVLKGRWSAIDKHIPLYPSWIWFYTLFYYPVIVIVVSLVGRSHYQFVMIAFSYIMMLAAMCSTYLLVPVATPSDWRASVLGRSLSERALSWVRSIDGSNNCFPSGHAALTVLTAYHMSQLTGSLIAFLWAVCIHISCLVCKQHYVIDLVAGAGLGLATVFCYGHFLK